MAVAPCSDLQLLEMDAANSLIMSFEGNGCDCLTCSVASFWCSLPSDMIALMVSARSCALVNVAENTAASTGHGHRQNAVVDSVQASKMHFLTASC